MLEHVGTKGGKATQQLKIKIRLDEINQKVLAKEVFLKRYRDRVNQYRQNRKFQNNEKNSTNMSWENALKHITKRKIKKQNHFGARYGNEKNIKEKSNE